MNFTEFKSRYQGIFVALIDDHGQDQWHHFHDHEDLVRYLKAEFDDQKYPSSDVVSQASPEQCFKLLAEGKQDYVIIYLDRLTEHQWNTLQHPEYWKSEQAFAGWQKLITRPTEYH